MSARLNTMQVVILIMTILKTIQYVSIPIFLIALTIGFTITPMTFDVYAANPGGNSGVGSTLTLGTDIRGNTLIEDGLTINGQSYMVEYWAQTIPTQTFIVNQQIDVTLHYHLNGGLDKLANVALRIEDGEETKQIRWNQDYKGIQTLSVSDKEFFKNVIVSAWEDPNNHSAAFLNLKFQISENIEKSTLRIASWNSAMESWTNTFYDAIKVIDQTTSDMKLQKTMSDMESQTQHSLKTKSPLQQTIFGVSASHVQCNLEKELMIKNDGNPICVNSASISKLIALGLAKQA